MPYKVQHWTRLFHAGMPNKLRNRVIGNMIASLASATYRVTSRASERCARASYLYIKVRRFDGLYTCWHGAIAHCSYYRWAVIISQSLGLHHSPASLNTCSSVITGCYSLAMVNYYRVRWQYPTSREAFCVNSQRIYRARVCSVSCQLIMMMPPGYHRELYYVIVHVGWWDGRQHERRCPRQCFPATLWCFIVDSIVNIYKIISNSARDCSISYRIWSCDVPWTFKVNGSKVKITAGQRIFIKNRYNSGT